MERRDNFEWKIPKRNEESEVMTELVNLKIERRVSISVSPNDTALCILDNSPQLRVFYLNPLRTMSMKYEDKSEWISRQIVDMFELSILKNIDYWDILAHLSSLLSISDNHSKRIDLELIKWILLYLNEDFTRLSKSNQLIYRPLFDRFKSSLFQILILLNYSLSQDSHLDTSTDSILSGISINYVDSQVKLNLLYLLDVFRSSIMYLTTYNSLSNSPGHFNTSIPLQLQYSLKHAGKN
jgi:hypothetical protein